MKQKILVVDNNPVICTLLAALLGDEFEVTTVTNGDDAYELALKTSPDLILLDIVMPHTNGYEVCAKLKRNAATSSIPVIFLTAKEDAKDETNGLNLGAVDYIKKPFTPPIVRARIRTHLELKQQRDSLLQKNIQLNESIRFKTIMDRQAQAEKERVLKQSAMIHSGRLASIGEITTRMVHEIGNPLNAISIILQKWDMLLTKDRLNHETIKKDLRELHGNVNRISRLTSHIKSLGSSNQENVETEIPPIVKAAVSLCRIQHEGKNIRFEEHFDKNLPNVLAVPAELEQVILNLLSNACYSLEEMLSREEDFNPLITIRVQQSDDKVCIFVEDNGGGVPIQQEEYIFEPFYTTKPAQRGTGLGLSISREIMEKFKGGLVLHNRPKVGATFEAWLPILQTNT